MSNIEKRVVDALKSLIAAGREGNLKIKSKKKNKKIDDFKVAWRIGRRPWNAYKPE